MRAYAWFLLAIAGTLLLAAGLSYPLYQFIHPLNPDWQFHKIASRFWQLTMLGGVALCIWRLGLRGKLAWGWAKPRPQFMRLFGWGLAVGIATMVPMSLAMLALDIRSPRPDLDAAMVAEAVLKGILSGLAVGLVEETFFRGLMYGAVKRESGVRVAVLATATIYAAIHFLARTKIPHAEVDAMSGLTLLAGTLRWFGDPAAMADAFLTLFAVGVLLAWVREWSGAIPACIGLHMGWVAVIKITVALTAAQPESPSYWLVSRFDGFVGWLVAAWCALILAFAWSQRARLQSLLR